MNTTKREDHSTILLWIVGMLIAIIVAGGALWTLDRAQHTRDMIQANNDLAQLFPLKHINDSLAVRVVQVKADLSKEMAKTSQLKRLITERDQKILMLINARMETRIDTLRLLVRYRDGSTCYFDTTNQWFGVAGWYDTTAITIQALETRDSVTVAIATAKNNILYGYVQNHSPYNRITNADFSIDIGQYQPQVPWFKKVSPYVRAVALGATLFDTPRREMWSGLALGFTVFEIVF